MNKIFEIADKTNKLIRLTDKQWTHITEDHPYMANYLEEMKETTTKPDKITESLLDIDARYYYKYYKHKEGRYKFLLVLVKYLNGDGFIITSYFVDKIK